MNALIWQTRAKEEAAQKQHQGFKGKQRGEYLKVRGTKFSSCFAIAGGERMKVDDRCEFSQGDGAGLRPRLLLPRETKERGLKHKLSDTMEGV